MESTAALAGTSDNYTRMSPQDDTVLRGATEAPCAYFHTEEEKGGSHECIVTENNLHCFIRKFLNESAGQ